jgi:transposase
MTTRPRPIGRPSKFTDDRRKRFIDAIRVGNYIDVAATYAGVDRSTVFRWLAMGREAKSGAYRDFFDEVKQAEAESEHAAVVLVRSAARDPRNWTAAMTFLERRFRDRWARPAAGSTMDGAPAIPEGTQPSTPVDEPVTVPLRDRVAGILRVLDQTGMMESHAEPTNGKPNGSAPGSG